MTKLLYYDQDSRRIRAIVRALCRRFEVSVACNFLELATLLHEKRPSILLLGFVSRDEAFNDAHLECFRRTIAHANAQSREAGRTLSIFVLPEADARRFGSASLSLSVGERFSALNSIPCCELHLLNLPAHIRALSSIISELEKASFSPSEPDSPIIGKSTKIRDVVACLQSCAKDNQSVLIVGETGTGKELAARALHAWSAQNEKPFVALNCAAIPETLFESEMFGTERGAYTDASTRRGAIEEADMGTLFLDEIGSLSSGTQPRLLRVLETGEYRRLGSPAPHSAHFRLVSASCLNPIDLAADHKFRNDLLFRIANFVVEIPPLRDRIEDIPPLADHFCTRFSKDGCPIDDGALEKLAGHDWPGNVRELKAVIARACASQKTGKIRADDIEFLAGISRLAPKAS